MEQKPRVLLIDESEYTLEGLRAYLSSRFLVLTAPHALSALSQFSETHLDLIIADLLMPACFGSGLIASLREQHPRTPIIAMTGWGKTQLADLNADSLLMKPFDLEDLEEAIGDLMRPLS